MSSKCFEKLEISTFFQIILLNTFCFHHYSKISTSFISVNTSERTITTSSYYDHAAYSYFSSVETTHFFIIPSLILRPQYHINHGPFLQFFVSNFQATAFIGASCKGFLFHAKTGRNLRLV